ncbi:hypothetical protein [Mycoplana ramosa]|uniref:HTH cro/C1-type domain-containing protein n=1 Tax=Mycoplana ramosa TaxID=40837 RepID=A0ABW3YT44_MYCRA
MHIFRNARYSNASNTMIDVEYEHPKYGWIPFTATPDDFESLGREIYAAAKAGPVAPYIPPTPEQIRERMPPITARQLRLTLVRNGHSLASVDAAIAALPEGPVKDEAAIEWEYGTTFARLSPTLITIAEALNISPGA